MLLSTASEAIRKAAALAGVKSGKIEYIHDTENQSDSQEIARVYNRNNPDGVAIIQGEAENALCYTWREINGQ